MDIKAFKMDGLGNDFVIVDQRNTQINLSKDQIIKICDRDFMGCDQLIMIKKNRKIDAGLEFYNSDGSVSSACGNGTRCVADLIAKESDKKTIILTTESGNLKSEILGDKLVSTEIGIAKTKWNEIPLSENLDTKNLNMKIYDLDNKEYVGGTAVNVGNPHIIFFVKDNENFDIKKLIGAGGIFATATALLGNPDDVTDQIMERGEGMDVASIRAEVQEAFKDETGEALKALRVKYPFLGRMDTKDIANMANGGRIGRAEGGIMDLGGMEKDYRNTGGFVDLGAKEKADDVPARLSVNEFVFTADAVRNAGGGDIDKGAEVMENMMKHLEQGGQVSDESQGMAGAQQMFETSERLSEVI